MTPRLERTIFYFTLYDILAIDGSLIPLSLFFLKISIYSVIRSNKHTKSNRFHNLFCFNCLHKLKLIVIKLITFFLVGNKEKIKKNKNKTRKTEKAKTKCES